MKLIHQIFFSVNRDQKLLTESKIYSKDIIENFKNI